jgi:hypothetical protein
MHPDQIVAVGNPQHRRLRVRLRGRAHRFSICYAGPLAVSVGVAWLDLTRVEPYVRLAVARWSDASRFLIGLVTSVRLN